MKLKDGLAVLFDKEKILIRLAEYPLLRLLFFSFWFRLAFLGFVGLMIFLALFLPKIWRTTPPGFIPVYRASGLNLVQAWSLKRGALQALAAGKTNDALYGWQAALAYNPTNPDLIRGLLRTLRTDTGTNQYLEMSIQYSFWLLRLSATNLADVELVSQVFERYRLTDWTLGMLTPLNHRLSPSLEKAYLKALFNADQIKEFASRWEAVNPSVIDAELRLYQAAYRAGWGTVNERLQGKESLDAALTNAEWRGLANRLSMAVGFQAGDVQRFAQSLRRLSEWGLDTPVDHCNYWRLLSAFGRKADAMELAKAYRKPPGTGGEAIQLAETYAILGLADNAIDLLQRRTLEYAYDERIWMVWGDILIANQNWEAALRLAAQIRQTAAAQTTMVGYSHYLDGQAELGSGKPALAETAFQKAAAAEFKSPTVGLRIAEQISNLGHPRLAKEILLKLQKPLAENPNYWFLLVTVADRLRDAELRLAACATLYKLQPNAPNVRNNYAAALVTLRQQPAEAIKLTMELIAQVPDWAITKINHSQALLLNQRTRDAEAVLQTIDSSRLGSEESASYYMAWFEVYLNLQQTEKARQAAARINRRFLFPCEIQWLDQALAKL
jgi:predicted Zn-dependent protease